MLLVSGAYAMYCKITIARANAEINVATVVKNLFAFVFPLIWKKTEAVLIAIENFAVT